MDPRGFPTTLPEFQRVFPDDIAWLATNRIGKVRTNSSKLSTIVRATYTAQTVPVLFDETPIGLRWRRTLAEWLAGLETFVANFSFTKQTDTSPLDIIAAVVALDYLRFRFPDATQMPTTPVLDEFAKKWRARGSFEILAPR